MEVCEFLRNKGKVRNILSNNESKNKENQLRKRIKKQGSY